MASHHLGKESWAVWGVLGIEKDSLNLPLMQGDLKPVASGGGRHVGDAGGAVDAGEGGVGVVESLVGRSALPSSLSPLPL